MAELFDLAGYIERFLLSLNVQPTTYLYMFPRNVDVGKLQELINADVFPTIAKLAPAFSSAILLGIARFILHRVLFKPVAAYCMNLKYFKQDTDSDIERAFPVNSKSELKPLVAKFCSENKKPETAVWQYLWNRKRNISADKKASKFCEAAWRFFFYFYFCYVGYQTLFVPDTAVWITDTMEHWRGWPLQPMSKMVEYYYQVELGCYIHQLMWTEVQRSDSFEMILHHFVTIGLMITSYLTNFTRIGASILLLHDASDVLLESAKVFNYVKKYSTSAFNRKFCQYSCDGLFVLFATSFFVTRLILYPKYILFSVYFDASQHFGTDWMGYKAFVVMLTTLQALHVFWFYLIARMIYRLMLVSEVEGDVRSDDDDDEAADVEYSEGAGEKAKPLATKKKQ